MSALFAEMNQMAAIGLAALLNMLWYAAAVVAITWVGLRYWRRVNAATRYWIWTAVLGFLVVLPLLPGLVTQLETAGSASAAATPLATVPAVPQAVQQLAPVTLTVNSAPGSNPWPLWLLAIWIVIAAWQLTRLLRGVVSVKRLKAHAMVTPAAELPVQTRRKLQVLASDGIRSPVAVGYIHPAVILPTGLPASLDEGEMQDVLLHELAHLVRYDDWLNLATRMLGAILVLHPLAAVVLRQIEREREMACDDFVVAHTGSAQSYARSLARLHDLRSMEGTRLLAPALLGGKVSLADRIESLLRHGREFSARPSLANLGVSAFLLALLLGAGGLIPSWVAIAATKTKPAPQFEVASIKPIGPINRRNGHGHISVGWTPGRFSFVDLTVSNLIDVAYNLEPNEVEGLPLWAKKQRYVIEAVVPQDLASQIEAAKKLPPAQRMRRMTRYREIRSQMLQSLLADRFRLKVHRATKTLPVYDLVLAKGGPKLRQDGKPGRSWFISNRYEEALKLQGVPVARLALCLSTGSAGLFPLVGRPSTTGRMVIDKTGLKGTYDIKLAWNPLLGGMSTMNPGPLSYTNASRWPSLFTAIQEQLGLKLKPAKAPVKVLVVDHIEPPTPN